MTDINTSLVCWPFSTVVFDLALLLCITLTAWSAPDWRSEIIRSISEVESCVRLAKVRTSSATTANPRPCSPARAASMAAFSASKLVWSAIPFITSSTVPIPSLCDLSVSKTSDELSISAARALMESIVSSTNRLPDWASWSALMAAWVAFSVFLATSSMVELISVIAVATWIVSLCCCDMPLLDSALTWLICSAENDSWFAERTTSVITLCNLLMKLLKWRLNWPISSVLLTAKRLVKSPRPLAISFKIRLVCTIGFTIPMTMRRVITIPTIRAIKVPIILADFASWDATTCSSPRTTINTSSAATMSFNSPRIRSIYIFPFPCSIIIAISSMVIGYSFIARRASISSCAAWVIQSPTRFSSACKSLWLMDEREINCLSCEIWTLKLACPCTKGSKDSSLPVSK